ncbi:MAG: DNA translocase FtsK, partial [Chloroflexota bacterium]
WLLGRSFSLFIWGVILVLSIVVVAGIKREHIVNWLSNTGRNLLIYSERLSGAAARVTIPEAPPAPEEVIALSTRSVPIMRIVQDMENLPPSLRNAILLGTLEDEEEKQEAYKEHPLFKEGGEDLSLDFNIIGEVTGKKHDDGVRVVKRPDGREKRYFAVQEMKESKKTGRRSKLLPSLDLLQEEEMALPDENEINHNVVLIENTLLEFDVDIDVVNVQVGPTVTRYAVQPYRTNPDGTTERTRLGKIASYHSDLSLSLSAKRLRLEIPVPGTNYMGIEVPNKQPSVVTLRSVYESKIFYETANKSSSSPLIIPLGRNVSGEAMTLDIAKMPHLLIAGTTGSGKSVAIAAMAVAIMLSNTPDTVRMVMLDPKMVELTRFNGIPHLLGPVETDTERIIGVLKWCTMEMDRRYKILEEEAVRNIDNYNARFGSTRHADYMPHMLIMIDEIGDLMMNAPEETERAITRLAQMARAVGMHLVIATQRPSVDVITGLIKANFPGRIAFAVASGVDSRVILDATGAEQLMGRGDMLYQAPDAGSPVRVQGCFVSDEETRAVVDHWKAWYAEKIADGKMEANRTGPWQRGLTRRQLLAETDPMLEDAIEYVVDTQEASASLIQRKLNLGYPRAARIIDMLEDLGVVGEAVGGGRARKVLIPKGEDPFKRIIDKRVKKRIRERKKEDGFYDS